MSVLQQGQHDDHQCDDQQDNAAYNLVNRHVYNAPLKLIRGGPLKFA